MARGHRHGDHRRFQMAQHVCTRKSNAGRTATNFTDSIDASSVVGSGTRSDSEEAQIRERIQERVQWLNPLQDEMVKKKVALLLAWKAESRSTREPHGLGLRSLPYASILITGCTTPSSELPWRP